MSSSVVADPRKKSRKKQLIALFTLLLLLLLVSLLGGLSSQLSPSDAETGLPAPPPPAVSRRSAMPPRPTTASPPQTPVEEILRSIARFGGSATAVTRELPMAGPAALPGPDSPPMVGDLPPRPADPDSPAPATAEPPLPPWPGLPPGSLPPPPFLAGDDQPWPLISQGPGHPIPPWEIREEHFLPLDNECGPAAPPVPEPTTLFLVGTGLACLAGLGRRLKPPS